jgi:DNA-binding transcriptional MerR regulator
MNEAQYQLIKVIHKLRLFKGFEIKEVQRLLPICRYTLYDLCLD